MKKYKNYLILQHDQKDCGCACLRMILKFYGGDSNLEYLKELSGTTSRGTSFLGLIQASSNTGLNATAYKASINDLKDLKDPVILHTREENGFKHFITFFEESNGTFIIGDPAFGIRKYSESELLEIWQDGYLLLFAKTEDFEEVSIKRIPHLKWLLTIMSEDSSFYISAVFMGVIVALLNMVTLVFTEKLIDVIVPSRDLYLLFKSIIIWGALILTSIILVYIRSIVLIRQAYRFNTRIITFFFRRLLFMPKVFFDSKRQGDMISRMNDTERLQDNIKTIVADSFIECFVIFISILFLSFYSFEATLIVILAIPTLYVCTNLFNTVVKKAQHRMFINYAITESNYIDTISGIEAIKSFSKENFFINKNKKIYTAFQDSLMTLVLKSLNQNLLIEIIGAILSISAIAFAILQVVEMTIQVGDLIAIVSLSMMAISAIKDVVQLNIDIIESKVTLERMFDFVERSEKNTEHEHDKYENIPIEIDSILLKNLSFSYPGQESLIEKANLRGEIGKITFLKGKSGSGKSTLAQLILQFYQPLSGKITINDNLNITQIKKSQWRDTIAYVPQNIKIFNAAVGFNISLNENTNEDEIINFFKNWDIFDNFFSRFKESYQTILGEEGVNPSGGEKQLIAIARALYKKPKVLILDEPTSGMDEETHRRIISLLNEIKKKMIIIFITHKEELLAGQEDLYVLTNKEIKIINDSDF